MRLLTVVGSAMLIWLSAGIAWGQWPQATYNDRFWELEAGVRIMERKGSDLNLPVVFDSITNNTLLSSDQATDLETGAGPEMRMLHRRPGGTEYEIRWYYSPWSIDETVRGANLQSPFLVGLNPTQVDYSYESDLFSIELNCRRAVLPGLTILAGPRFIYLEDNVLFSAELSPIVTLDSEIRTKNPMFGFQVGGEVNLPLTRQLYFKGSVKVGGYGNIVNSVNRNTLVVAGANNPISQLDLEKSHGSFVAELGGKLYYDVIPGTASFYAGYEATWLDGVGVAPAQILTNFNPINTSTTPFINGGVVGAMFRW